MREDLRKEIDLHKRMARADAISSRLFRVTCLLASATLLGILGVTWDRTIPDLLRSLFSLL